MAEYYHKIAMFIDLQILQAADERREAEIYQKDEEIRQKNTQLEVTLGRHYQTIYVVCAMDL